ncbi:MAG: hypothetical protein ABIN89_15605 [Chitinophagaceae bacterium]
MKRLYALALLLSPVLFFGCSKDFLKSYDNRIIGTWRITNVNKVGLGGNSNNLPFTSGTFTFHENGSLSYVNSANVSFTGSWQIDRTEINDQTVRRLQITAIDFSNQELLSEFYDDMNFTSTNHFKANINSGFHTYVTHFHR